MMIFDFKILYVVGTLLVLILLWLHLRIKSMSILHRNGIPGKIPHIIFGNIFDMKHLSLVERQNVLIEKYGKIVGYYTGAKPNILVADPELAKTILIKDFHNFTNRSNYIKYFHPSYKADSALVIAKDNRWKQIRSLLSPAFSASKMKEMTPLIVGSVDSFLDIINENSVSGNEFNIYELYQRLSVEVILKTAFGVEIDAQNDINNKLVRNVRLYLESKVNKLFLIIFVCFPKIGSIIQTIRGIAEVTFYYMGYYPSTYLMRTCGQIIKLRKDRPSLRRNDILQAMIDSNVNEESMKSMNIESNNDREDISNNKEQNEKNNNKNNIQLTGMEIEINCVVFLGGGYDTTSTALSYITHMLINYPDIQEKVRQEVKELFDKEGILDYNCVNKLQYMECVINETLRIHPPLVNGTTRECAQEYKYKNMIIPKGATIVICTHYLQNDPDYWPEPKSFDPMRFSHERRHKIKKGCWLPFGEGPRNCIAFRLSYLKIKLILAKLLLEYKLVMGPSTEIGELATIYKMFTVIPKNGVFVKAIKLQ